MSDLNFKNVDRYCDLDLGADCSAVKALKDPKLVEKEANGGEVFLTDITGSDPAYLTPHARNWYSTHIESCRRAALDEVHSAMQKIGQRTGVNASLLERQIDEIDDKALKDKIDVKRSHRQQNVGALEELNEKKQSYQNSKMQYDRKRLQRGREPKIPGLIYYFAIVFVGFFEALINFETFATLSFMTPAIALGSTVVIAIILALSSHLHGKFLKEAQHVFGAQRKDGELASAWRMFGIATLGLSIVLWAVYYARSNYLADIILEQTVIGGTPPSWFSTVGGSLLLNLGVWVAGVILSYMSHDPDPEYPEAYQSYVKHRDDYRTSQLKLEKDVERRFEQIDAQASIERDHARTFDESMSNDAEFQTARQAFQRIKSKDSEVLGLLRTYQSELASMAKDAKLKLTKQSDLESATPTELTHAEYSALQLKMKYV